MDLNETPPKRARLHESIPMLISPFPMKTVRRNILLYPLSISLHDSKSSLYRVQTQASIITPPRPPPQVPQVPEYILCHILSFLDTRALLTRAGRVCSSWRSNALKCVRKVRIACNAAMAFAATNLPSIQHLHLRIIPALNDSALPLIQNFTQLTTLELTPNFPQARMLQVLRAANACQCLHSLILRCILYTLTADDAELIAENLGSRLEHIELNTAFTQSFCAALRTSSLPRLQSISIIANATLEPYLMPELIQEPFRSQIRRVTFEDATAVNLNRLSLMTGLKHLKLISTFTSLDIAAVKEIAAKAAWSHCIETLQINTVNSYIVPASNVHSEVEQWKKFFPLLNHMSVYYEDRFVREAFFTFSSAASPDDAMAL